ncbi:Stk1 family PASTA domain-containing Ser/Thr kinase [Demequina aestuarii]|uniref:Stk1 family PASTA domain-containing Ser/Thr kinase n=1 Tax=Demequina aestuarii TaxID=327095 RepID=UPI0009FDBE49|nr:Stk1 family PASTA domain-containing Ser/Thr kinase [Demequina aestuarii]
MNDDANMLAGRYEVGDLIGRGGMAEVHIGYDTRLGRTVAIKILRADLARDPSFQTRFRREAQSAAGLNHPSIVAVYDTGEDHIPGATGNPQAVPFIVMEYVEGHTVRDILKGDVAAPIDEAVEIASGVLTALDYAHHAGLVHRDIKPANVMLTPTGAVKVMDFGIARALADAGNTMTQTQAVVGTAQYLSPEQARGETVDARSDLYSAGCLLFELLTGRPPFIGDSPVSVAYQHVREEAPKPSDFASDVPTALDQVVLRALAKNRDHRYATAQEFLGDLRAVMGGGQVSPSTGAIAVGSAAFGAGAAGVAAAAGMTPEQIEDQPTQAMPAQQSGPATDATQVMPADASPAWASVGGAGSVPPPQSSTVAVSDERELDDEDDSRRRKIILWVSLGVAALIAIILLILLFNRDDEPEVIMVAVPDVVGMTEAEALAELDDVGLVGETTTEPSAEIDEGLVISTDPAADDEVEEGTSVSVLVSAGPDAVEIPSVRGLREEDAVRQLEELGLVVTIGDPDDDDPDLEEGRVTRTEPVESTEVPGGSTVELFLSSGMVELPDLVGADEDAARAQLNKLGLIPDTTDVPDDSVAPGTVLSQSPGAGRVPQRSTVNLEVAVAPSTVAVPDVTGRSKADAERELGTQDLSFAYDAEQFSDDIPSGSVISQNPNGGTQVAPGTQVRLVLSKGPEPEPEPEPEPTGGA